MCTFQMYTKRFGFDILLIVYFKTSVTFQIALILLWEINYLDKSDIKTRLCNFIIYIMVTFVACMYVIRKTNNIYMPGVELLQFSILFIFSSSWRVFTYYYFPPMWGLLQCDIFSLAL